MTSVNVNDSQTHLPDTGDEKNDALAPHNVDAHMPPQPAPQDPVWATPKWNPETNEWAPSNEQHETWGVAEPVHTDDPTAEPVSESYGQAASGTTPDDKLNLLDAVRDRGPQAPPVVHYTHDVRTTDTGAETVRFHQESVQSATVPTALLQQNGNRKRALLRALGSPVVYQTGIGPNNVTSSTGWTTTVPAGQTWSNIQNWVFTLTTDATVGNRTLTIFVRDPLNRLIATYTFATAQAASLTRTYQALNGAATDVLTGTTVTFPNILNGLVLQAGSSINVVNVGTIGGGDVYSALLGDVNIGGAVYLTPLRDGGAPAGANFGWPLSPGDPPIEIKAEAGIEAILFGGTTITVAVYEELLTSGGVPGIST